MRFLGKPPGVKGLSCFHIVFKLSSDNTWYSFSISTTISALRLDLLHHPWSNSIDPDIHPTAMTCIARYHWILQTANNPLQIPHIFWAACIMKESSQNIVCMNSIILVHLIVACTMHFHEKYLVHLGSIILKKYTELIN